MEAGTLRHMTETNPEAGNKSGEGYPTSRDIECEPGNGALVKLSPEVSKERPGSFHLCCRLGFCHPNTSYLDIWYYVFRWVPHICGRHIWRLLSEASFWATQENIYHELLISVLLFYPFYLSRGVQDQICAWWMMSGFLGCTLGGHHSGPGRGEGGPDQGVWLEVRHMEMQKGSRFEYWLDHW